MRAVSSAVVNTQYESRERLDSLVPSRLLALRVMRKMMVVNRDFRFATAGDRPFSFSVVPAR